MSLKKRVSRIGGFNSDIIKSAESASNERGPTLTTTPDEITRLWNHEYGKALRACLSRAEVREIGSVGRRKAWPQLNDGAARIGSMREFEERASDLGAELRIAKMAWPSGLAVLGFYLGSDSGLDNRPLICLNGAHHPAAVATAFLHEVGHHVTARLFSSRDVTVRLSRQTGYDAHLTDPRELAADVLVSLGVYPRTMAERLFDSGSVRKTSRSADQRAESQGASK